MALRRLHRRGARRARRVVGHADAHPRHRRCVRRRRHQAQWRSRSDRPRRSKRQSDHLSRCIVRRRCQQLPEVRDTAGRGLRFLQPHRQVRRPRGDADGGRLAHRLRGLPRDGAWRPVARDVGFAHHIGRCARDRTLSATPSHGARLCSLARQGGRHVRGRVPRRAGSRHGAGRCRICSVARCAMPVPFIAYLFYKWACHPCAEPEAFGEALNPDGIVAQARRIIDEFGFTAIKLKGGGFPPEEEMAAIEALHAASPTTRCGWTPTPPGHRRRRSRWLRAWRASWSTSRIRRPASTGWLKSPSRRRCRWRRICASSMCVVAFDHLAPAVAKDSVRVVLSDHHYRGGLQRSHAGRYLRDLRPRAVDAFHSHMGISLAAMVHLASATPNLTYACDKHWPWKTEEIVKPGALEFVDGSMAVPTTPGLGVEIDELRDADVYVGSRFHRAAAEVLVANTFHHELHRRVHRRGGSDAAPRLSPPGPELRRDIWAMSVYDPAIPQPSALGDARIGFVRSSGTATRRATTSAHRPTCPSLTCRIF